MAEVKFTRSLLRRLVSAPLQVGGSTVGEALTELFRRHPDLRQELLDSQGALQKDIVVFVNGAMIEDRQRLSDPIDSGSELYILEGVP